MSTEPNAWKREVAAIESLLQALDWAASRRPKAEFVDVVAQDEFTQDVVARVVGDWHVVFEST